MSKVAIGYLPTKPIKAQNNSLGTHEIGNNKAKQPRSGLTCFRDCVGAELNSRMGFSMNTSRFRLSTKKTRG